MRRPAALNAIEVDTKALGFTMSSDDLTGNLLRTLAASKPGGKLLELGTGTGHATAWLLDGMDAQATLLTIDNDAEATAIAQKQLGEDDRLTVETGDGLELLKRLQGQHFDFLFADTWPGKIDHPELALTLVAPGGFYIIDDLNLAWTERENIKPPVDDFILNIWHGQRRLLELLKTRDDFICTELRWSTGLMICTRKPINP